MMVNTVIKICLLCFLCETMRLVSSSPLKHPTSDAYSEVRAKRSPKDFSLLGYQLPFPVPNPSEQVTGALSSFRNIFKTERKHTDTPSEDAFSKIKINNQKKRNETHIISLAEEEKAAKKVEEIKPIRVSDHNDSEYDIDTKLIEDIFKDLMNEISPTENVNKEIQDNSERVIEEHLKRIMKDTRDMGKEEDIPTTTDGNVNTDTTDATGTNEYETTTNDDFYRIDSSVLASLLG
ncbi:unnamed protein product [Chrysodeixis includens]|uniref:Uncharacterized protein n=1 Tax=Chrysodeixis includens TaxID=689277 RepID=A0A9P0C362_CHRIL|nr:unnamed protein product [Chrysodeixis includens]